MKTIVALSVVVLVAVPLVHYSSSEVRETPFGPFAYEWNLDQKCVEIVTPLIDTLHFKNERGLHELFYLHGRHQNHAVPREDYVYSWRQRWVFGLYFSTRYSASHMMGLGEFVVLVTHRSIYFYNKQSHVFDLEFSLDNFSSDSDLVLSNDLFANCWSILDRDGRFKGIVRLHNDTGHISIVRWHGGDVYVGSGWGSEEIDGVHYLFTIELTDRNGATIYGYDSKEDVLVRM